MKLLINCALLILFSSTVYGQTKPKPQNKPIPVEHIFKEVKKTPNGFDLSIVSGTSWNDDSSRVVEICFPDSTITFAKMLYPEYKTFKKGELVKNIFYVAGDSIAPKAKVAPQGTFKTLYPKTGLTDGTASIAFLIDVDSLPGQEYMLPDLYLNKGQVAVGDTVQLSDNLGKKCTAKVIYLDIANKSLSSTIIVPFVTQSFYTDKEAIRVVMYYMVLSGDQGMHEQIRVSGI